MGKLCAHRTVIRVEPCFTIIVSSVRTIRCNIVGVLDTLSVAGDLVSYRVIKLLGKIKIFAFSICFSVRKISILRT